MGRGFEPLWVFEAQRAFQARALSQARPPHRECFIGCILTFGCQGSAGRRIRPPPRARGRKNIDRWYHIPFRGLSGPARGARSRRRGPGPLGPSPLRPASFSGELLGSGSYCHPQSPAGLGGHQRRPEGAKRSLGGRDRTAQGGPLDARRPWLSGD